MATVVLGIPQWVDQYHRLHLTEEEEMALRLDALRLLSSKTLDQKFTVPTPQQEVRHMRFQIQMLSQANPRLPLAAGIHLLNPSPHPYLLWNLRGFHQVSKNFQRLITTA